MAVEQPAPKPVSPTITSDIVAIEKKIGVWLDPAHIVLIALLAIALGTGIYFFESKRADIAEARAEIAAEVLKKAQQDAITESQKNALLQEQTKEVIAQMAAANQQLQAANVQLQSANQQLTSKLLAQQTTDKQLPPSGQAARWEQLVPVATVTPTPTGFAIDASGGISTILALEEVPADRQQITNLTAEVVNDQKTIANDAVSLKAEQDAHQSDNVADQKKIVAALDDNKKILADYNAYKKKARRNYFRIFFAGALFGLIGGHEAGI